MRTIYQGDDVYIITCFDIIIILLTNEFNSVHQVVCGVLLCAMVMTMYSCPPKDPGPVVHNFDIFYRKHYFCLKSENYASMQ